jgi:hypothetical protein
MLGISPEKVCWIIIKAREFDVKVDIVEPDPGSNPADGDMREVLEDYADDPIYQELVEFIDSLNEDEQVELVALAWVGRGDYGVDEWRDVLEQARGARTSHTASYLLGMPLVSDYLEEGLAQMDYSCEEFEMGRL